jgi:uncharacterized membrane protein YedE/YeeE
MEIWSGMVLLAVLAFVLGFALNHGSICTVIATTELIAERRSARSIALVECAVWAALVYAIIEQSPTMQQGWSPLPYLVPGALLFGIGAYVNGACVFGSVGHFGNGHIDFGFTFLAIFAVLYIESLFGLLPAQPSISASLPFGPVLLAIALAAILALRLGVSLRSESNFGRLTLSMDHLYDPGGARAPVLDHDLGRIDRLDPCRGHRNFRLHVRRQLCLRKIQEGPICAGVANSQEHRQ